MVGKTLSLQPLMQEAVLTKIPRKTQTKMMVHREVEVEARTLEVLGRLDHPLGVGQAMHLSPATDVDSGDMG